MNEPLLPTTTCSQQTASTQMAQSLPTAPAVLAVCSHGVLEIVYQRQIWGGVVSTQLHAVTIGRAQVAAHGAAGRVPKECQ